jgi:hypothetical protein
MSKREEIKKLSEEHPELSRRALAERAGCSPAYVTQALGAVRVYKPRQEKQEPEKVVG